MTKLKVATCQFPMSADINTNKTYILDQLHEAAKLGCDVAHFPEGSLSGYGTIDFQSFDGYDWDSLRQATVGIMDCARTLSIWVILGSAHRIMNGPSALPSLLKPYNCLYIIDDQGKIVDR